MSYGYNQYREIPEFTFIGSPEDFGKPLEYKHLNFPFLVLRFKPKCDCGKEFRSSGEDTALQQVAKHLEHKKYKDCKPTVEKIDYSNVIPEFVSIRQIYGTKANLDRNYALKQDMDSADQYNYPTIIAGYQIAKGINLSAKVIRKSEIRNVKSRKTGEALQVCDVTLEDENGDTIPLVLWNGLTQKVNLNDNIVIKNAFVKDGQEYHQGFGYSQRTELGTYKNATTIEVDNS